METVIFVLEIVGTLAFAASGALTGIKKNMDIFGVCILGLTTAVGGGVIRDLILGNTPPATFQNPIYAVLAVAASLIMFLPRLRRLLLRNKRAFEVMMFFMDTVGLGIFTVVGIRIANTVAPDSSVFLQAFVGVLTGVGGGIMRDIMAGDTPYIFVKHIYACASLAGALVCSVMWEPLGEVLAVTAGVLCVIIIRILSAHFRWNLPKAHD